MSLKDEYINSILAKHSHIEDQVLHEEISENRVLKKIVVLTEINNEGLGPGAVRIADVARKKFKLESHLINVVNSRYDILEDSIRFETLLLDEKGLIAKDPTIVTIDNNTLVIPRSAVMNSYYTQQIMRDIQQSGYAVLNSLNSIDICDNKYRTYKVLKKADIPQPKTVLLPNNDMTLDTVEKSGIKFPAVMKTMTGCQGVGVMLIDSASMCVAVAQTIWKLDEKQVLLLQEYIKADGDLRIHIIGGEFIAAMKRLHGNKEFRSNYSITHTAEKFEPSEEVIEIAKKCAQEIKLSWAGVDIIFDKQKNPYVLEVNTSPGLEGIESVSGVNVTEKLLNFIIGN